MKKILVLALFTSIFGCSQRVVLLTNSTDRPIIINQKGEYILIEDDQYSAGSILWFDEKYSDDFQIEFEFQIFDDDGQVGPSSWNSADGISIILFKEKKSYLNKTIPCGDKRGFIEDGTGLGIHLSIYGQRKIIIKDGNGIELKVKAVNTLYTHQDWGKCKVLVEGNILKCFINNKLEVEISISEVFRNNVRRGFAIGAGTGGADSKHTVRNVMISKPQN